MFFFKEAQVLQGVGPVVYVDLDFTSSRNRDRDRRVRITIEPGMPAHKVATILCQAADLVERGPDA